TAPRLTYSVLPPTTTKPSQTPRQMRRRARSQSGSRQARADAFSSMESFGLLRVLGFEVPGRRDRLRHLRRHYVVAAAIVVLCPQHMARIVGVDLLPDILEHLAQVVDRHAVVTKLQHSVDHAPVEGAIAEIAHRPLLLLAQLFAVGGHGS